ncbi:MAG TPA: WYL domain-containing protein, partial [Ktedonobacteraceae bacterium]|nr:WYL domain-containing protein [Ktedonobacteraceae bacterium]
IEYDSRSQVTEILIYPYGLYAFNGFWYCACFDYKCQQHVSLRADRFLSFQRIEGEKLATPPKMSLREWLQQSDPDEEPLLSLHVVINKHGMKHVDWAAFTREVIVDEDGNGIIRKQVSAGNYLSMPGCCYLWAAM